MGPLVTWAPCGARRGRGGLAAVAGGAAGLPRGRKWWTTRVGRAARAAASVFTAASYYKKRCSKKSARARTAPGLPGVNLSHDRFHACPEGFSWAAQNSTHQHAVDAAVMAHNGRDAVEPRVSSI